MYNTFNPVFGNALGNSLNPFFEAKMGKRKHAQDLELTKAMAAGQVAGMPGQGGGEMPMEAVNPFGGGNVSQVDPQIMLQLAPMLMGLPPVA